jgi:hypothetical protein
MVVTAAMALAACCGSVDVATYCRSVAVTTSYHSVAVAALRGASLIAAAVLSATRVALDERRLVGTTVSDLSTLAGVRGGTVGVTLRTHKRKNQIPALSRTGCLEE